ncbi:fimbrial biogenesis chaperone [Ottowia thiooxydans]|uniref:fimbrial biogenesis chaperone n=1 Tax=Ottowia thiooxydans TaxID=219182 RepID=UPI00048FE9A7|nr:molecular chaperone [Ottowia thiooxydans]
MRFMWLVGVLLGASAANAAGLQVAPVTLTLQSSQQADGLWLTNTDQAQLDAQVRVFRWTQQDGQEQMEPTRELVISPPMLRLPAGERQLVRVIRSGPPPAATAESAYRVLIDELPLPRTEGASGGEGKGLKFVMRHSLPIFVSPAGAPPSAPQLKWTLRSEGVQTLLEVANSGGTHAQLADLWFTDSTGNRLSVHKGLLGYVLPGATMRWQLQLPAAATAASGRWQVLLNGRTTEQEIAPPDRKN